MAAEIVISVGCELPAWRLFWADDDGQAVDLSSGWTFGYLDATAAPVFTAGSILLKVKGVPYVIAGTFTANATPTLRTGSASDIPTLTFAPNAGQLDAIPTGKGRVFAAAQSGTKQRPGWWPVTVEDPTA